MAEAVDADTIERAQRGDRAAFEEVLRAHYDAMYRIAYKWCGNKADAEDITQNACIKLARSISGYRFESAFLTWLYPLVINTAKDWAKSRAGRPESAAEDVVWDVAGAARADGPGHEHAAEERVYARQVMDKVRSLPAKEKEALYLVVSAGLTHREAATVMECKESTVSWYIHEARKKLQPLRMMERRHG